MVDVHDTSSGQDLSLYRVDRLWQRRRFSIEGRNKISHPTGISHDFGLRTVVDLITETFGSSPSPREIRYLTFVVPREEPLPRRTIDTIANKSKTIPGVN